MVNFVDNNNRLQAVSKRFWLRSAFAASGRQMRQPPAALSLPWTLHVQLHHRSRRARGINDVDTVIIPFDSGVFARMVIPRSFSKSLESITRSWVSARESNVPDCWSSLSTGGFTMVYVRDDGDITQFFDHNFASGIRNSALLYTD